MVLSLEVITVAFRLGLTDWLVMVGSFVRQVSVEFVSWKIVHSEIDKNVPELDNFSIPKY